MQYQRYVFLISEPGAISELDYEILFPLQVGACKVKKKKKIAASLY